MKVEMRAVNADSGSKSRGKKSEVNTSLLTCTAFKRNVTSGIEPALIISGTYEGWGTSGVRGGMPKSGVNTTFKLTFTGADLQKIMEVAAKEGILPVLELQEAHDALSRCMEKLNLVVPRTKTLERG